MPDRPAKCLASHEWAPWSWRSAQFPAEGRKLEVVWARDCATCRWKETCRTRPHQPPSDTDAAVHGVLSRPPAPPAP